MNLFMKVKGALLLILSLMLLTACGFGEEENAQEIDAPPVNYIDETEDGAETNAIENGEEDIEMTWRELYLFDKNGYVVPQTIQVPKSIKVAAQSIEYLVKDGPVNELLPNGFEAVLPAGTEILGINIDKNKTATVDFSEEFTNYLPEDEMKILQAITWTLTQFETINTVKIRINGAELDTMPVAGSPIKNGMSRENGINFENGYVSDFVNSKPVTLYFLANNKDNLYYVPVTRRVELGKDDFVAVVDELLNGPLHSTPLLTDFKAGVELITKPEYKDGVLTLNFNPALLGDAEGTAISEYVLQSLVLSLTEQQGIEEVAIMINGNPEVMMATGELLAKPVARPLNVNKVKY
jgi:germination protein M